MSENELERAEEISKRKTERPEILEPEVGSRKWVEWLRGKLPHVVRFTRATLPVMNGIHPAFKAIGPIMDALGAAGGANAAQANAMRGFETRVSGAVDSVGRAQAGVERMVREQGMQIAGLELRLKQLQIAAEDAATEQTALRLEMQRTQSWLKIVTAGLVFCGLLLIALVVLWLVRRG
jgi:hypothetical protein